MDTIIDLYTTIWDALAARPAVTIGAFAVVAAAAAVLARPRRS